MYFEYFSTGVSPNSANESVAAAAARFSGPESVADEKIGKAQQRNRLGQREVASIDRGASRRSSR